jgi:NADH-quinone oxidoreductase subunit M
MDPNTAGWALVVALFLPLVGAGLLALMPASMDRRSAGRRRSSPVSAFALVAAITASFDYGRSGELQFTTDVGWITAINARFSSAWTASRCRCSS